MAGQTANHEAATAAGEDCPVQQQTALKTHKEYQDIRILPQLYGTVNKIRADALKLSCRAVLELELVDSTAPNNPTKQQQ